MSVLTELQFLVHRGQIGICFVEQNENTEYMIVIPTYGSIVGGWFGAWPMPLDWERPWQEWPICVCYGAIGGYIIGQILSLSLMFLFRKHKNLKIERQQ
ncbi:unnamed protein product [Eruca vesicaria subsp. sativa]|uniref:Phosphatidylinositol-glycan biosynthesis class F protein n=1 Tax=Eruca vesicaria subsp. sativa TaxID=29727 RepID=A0ABC8LZU4_ERUVS|nr:unnamed protein product [Eruca vesicaria subsp. sativa]